MEFDGLQMNHHAPNTKTEHAIKKEIIYVYMSPIVRKWDYCLCENKGAKLISAFVFATRIVQFLFYLNPKFQASSSFLYLYRPVCVGPVRKPHCWFSHEAAHMFIRCYLYFLYVTAPLSPCRGPVTLTSRWPVTSASR